MVSTKAVRQALYQKLNVASVTSLLANGSASIHHGVAPLTAAYPLLIFNKQSGVTTNRMGGEAFKNTLWLVKGVARATSSSTAEDIDKAVNDLLHFGALTITGADDMYLARESDVEYVETSGDTQYRHVGGLYRLTYQDA
jgi:hypothetical protein